MNALHYQDLEEGCGEVHIPEALAGIELMHTIQKRQMVVDAGDEGLTAADQFYALAA